jgi:hypothetical protein
LQGKWHKEGRTGTGDVNGNCGPKSAGLSMDDVERKEMRIGDQEEGKEERSERRF